MKFESRIPTPDLSPLLTVRQAAEVQGCSPDTVRDLAHRGELTHIRLGPGQGHFRFEPDDLQAFIRARRRGGEGPKGP